MYVNKLSNHPSSIINKPSFCSGSCDDWHTTTTKQTFFERLLICFKPPLKSSLKDVRNTLETSLTSLKYPWNYIEKPLYLPWNTHHWNFLEISVKLIWNLLETCLKLAWITLETYLKHPWNTFEISFTLPWNYLETFNFREIPLKLP